MVGTCKRLFMCSFQFQWSLYSDLWESFLAASLLSALGLNPLSPNIQIQILQTDLYTFPLRIS